MMKKVVHNAKALTKALERFILENVTGHRSGFEVSGTKADGTVVVRFRSSPVDTSTDLVRRFGAALEAHELGFTWVDETRVRVWLGQFSPERV